MPGTLNGIGTTYYGSKNLERYRDVCESCGRETELQNYETKLWFTIFFVPVIPLGKKQIFGDCTICRRHRVMSADEWAKVKEDALRKQMEAVGANPSDPDAAIELLGMFGAFSRKDDALRMADVLEKRFPDHVGVRLRLGEWYESNGEPVRADAHFRRALELDPRNLSAKHAVAVGYIQEGNIDGARRLLAAEPPLTPRDDPGAFLAMATQLQKQNQHEPALQVFRQLLEVVPAWSRDPAFRKQVRISEQQAGGDGRSLLPRIPITGRGWFWPSVIAGGAAAAILFAQYYIYHHRTLHVVNGYDRPVEVRLASGERVSVPPREWRKLSLAEGPHRATVVVAGRPDRDTDFVVESNGWKRLVNSPAYVLNVDGAAVVVWEQTVYRKKVVNDDAEYDVKFHLGKPFVAIDDVDYLFQEFPDQLREKNSKVVKTRVGVEQVSPTAILFGAPDSVIPDDRLSFAEAHLRMNENDADLLTKYAFYAEMTNQSERCLQFLQQGLDARPVSIHWHRAYQTVRGRTGDETALVNEYRKRLDAEPKSSAWLYLLGRVEPDPAVAEGLFQRSIDADPTNAFPWHAKSYALRLRGDFEGAKKAEMEAVRLDPKDPGMQEALYVVRLGAGDAATLETEVEREWQVNSSPVEFPSKLMEVLSVRGNKAKMSRVFEEYVRRVTSDTTEANNNEAVIRGEMDLAFYLGDYQKVLQLANSPSGTPEQSMRVVAAHAALGNIDDAAAALGSSQGTVQVYGRLALSLARRRDGDAKRADEFQKQALEALEAGDSDERRIAAVLRRVPNVSYDDARNLNTSDPYETALLLAMLGQQCPGDRAKLLDEAEKQNFRPWPFQKVISDAVAAARKLKD